MRFSYNIEKHRWILSPQYMTEFYGIDLMSHLDSDGSNTPERVPALFLDLVSRVAYGYVFRFAKNRYKAEYLMAKNERYTQTIVQAMGELAYIMLINNKADVLTGGERDYVSDIPIMVEDTLRGGGLLFRGDYSLVELNGFDMEKRGVEW